MKSISLGIGILAYNEAENLKLTLDSLFSQSIFSDIEIDQSNRIDQIEVCVVANGCSDDTAQIASEYFESRSKSHSKSGGQPELVTVVEDIATAGKSNAWNVYIHQVSMASLDYILMIDADIEFNQTETIRNSLKALLQDSAASVVVDTPLKSLHKKQHKSWIDQVSLKVSKDYLDTNLGIAGSFYCAAASCLRQVWMPIGLPGEDGFLKSMILTDMFRQDVDPNKLIRAENASHYYVPDDRLTAIYRRELRSIMGTAINCYITWDFLKFATDPNGPGAGVLLKRLIENDSNWLNKFLGNTIQNKGFWVLPKGVLFAPLSALKNKHWIKDFKSVAAALLRFAIKFPICIVANHKIKKGEAIGFW